MKDHERQRRESENSGARETEKQERQRSERDRGARETVEHKRQMSNRDKGVRETEKRELKKWSEIDWAVRETEK